MGYYAGQDVALRSVALCVVDGEGEIVPERALACEVDEIGECLHNPDHGACIWIEQKGVDARPSLLPASLPSSSTGCRPMVPHSQIAGSNGMIRR